MTEAPARALPLAGVRVVEFVHMVMGPTCGLVLADLGAEVIKVEPVPEGDNTRRLGGSGAGFWATFNRNKKSLAVDLKSAEGLALVRRLIATADVVTENFRPGAMTRLGLGYEALAADHPGLVYCSMKGFLTGPYEHRAALDEVVQMMGGLAYMTGPPGRPLRVGSSVNDIMGGMFGVIAILAALEERRRTGLGQEVRSALFENTVFLVAQHMAQFAVLGVPAPPMPQRQTAWAIYDIFDTADGEQVFVGVVTDTQWRLFCEAFALPHLLPEADPTLATNRSRVERRAYLLPAVAEALRHWTKPRLMELCEQTGLPYAPIVRPEELFDDPQVCQPHAMAPVTLPDGRRIALPTLPIELHGERLGVRLDLPRLGEHGADVARELGYAADEIDRLIADGVLRVD